MKKYVVVMLACLVVLAGCQRKDKEKTDAEVAVPVVVPALPLQVENKVLQRKRDCKGEDCAKVSASWPAFPQAQDLSRLVEKELVALASDHGEATVEAYATHYLADAPERWEATLSGTVRRQQGQLVVIELAAYLYTGGAHGMPINRLLNYDVRQQKVLALSDLILPGQDQAFWDQARKVYQQWVQATASDVPDYESSWPFQATDNFTLDAKGIVLKYGAYAIAPYATGEPELLLPYDVLKGIVKPEYLPH